MHSPGNYSGARKKKREAGERREFENAPVTATKRRLASKEKERKGDCATRRRMSARGRWVLRRPFWFFHRRKGQWGPRGEGRKDAKTKEPALSTFQGRRVEKSSNFIEKQKEKFPLWCKGKECLAEITSIRVMMDLVNGVKATDGVRRQSLSSPSRGNERGKKREERRQNRWSPSAVA